MIEKFEKLEYFWGLFDSPGRASASGAKCHVRFEAGTAPERVTQSFDDERIGELEGDFGLPGIGVPEEVDCLK